MSHRPEQLASSIQRAIQDRLARGLHDPRISGLITVTGVRVTADLQTAIISISVLPESKQDLTLHGLESSAKFIRREVGDVVQTRQLPDFVFKLDSSLKRQASVFRELDRARRDREEAERAQGAKTDPTPGAANDPAVTPTTDRPSEHGDPSR